MWQRFYRAMVRGLLMLGFYLVVMAAFRLFFIVWMYDYLGDAVGSADIALAFWHGSRLSIQTAGVITLVCGLPALLMGIFSAQQGEKMLKRLNAATILGMAMLYVARFPYYKQFHTGFNQLLFNTIHDDIGAILTTLTMEYFLPVRLLAAAILGWELYRFWRYLMRWEIPDFPTELSQPVKFFAQVMFIAVLVVVSRLVYYGGAFGWQTAIDWENAGITKDNLLNEAILDDCQAVFRGYTTNNRLLACNGLDFTVFEIRRLAAKLTHKAPDSNDLDTYLAKTAQGAQINKPKHIFLLISESYANWPLLPKYEGLPIASGMRGLLAEPESSYCGALLPNGGYTVSALTGITAGLADANLYLTTMPEALKGPYPTAAAPQLKRLGYQTNFWYAGPATWERIGEFTKAQGFDNFYSRGDFSEAPGTVWGCEDEYLYAAVLKGLPQESSFNVLLTASNHAPFSVNLEEKGFDRDAVRQLLPKDRQKDEELLTQLGHFWYGDRELANFIKTVREKYPDSLFIVVGDHADRYNIEKAPNTYTRCAIPLIIIGKGVTKGLLPFDAAGSHIDVVPTIIEMIAPEGFAYTSLGESLTRTAKRGVNYGWWITHNAIGKADTVPLVPESFDGSTPPVVEEAAMQDYINAIRAISWYRAKYGAILDEERLMAK